MDKRLAELLGTTTVPPSLIPKEEVKKKKDVRGFPRLPDGSRYQPLVPYSEDSKEYVQEASNILENWYDTYKLGKEHTHLIKMILDAFMRLKSLRGNTDPKFLDATRQLEKHIADLHNMLGLIEKNKPQDTPAHYVEELRRRAVELIAEKGAERSIACECGKILLVYTGKVHPFFQDNRYAIWSNEVREMMDRQCECGRPKLTLEDAAYILQLSPLGWSQIMQEYDRGDEEPTISTEEIEEEEGVSDESEDRLASISGSLSGNVEAETPDEFHIDGAGGT